MKALSNRFKSLLRLTAVALWVIIPSYSFAAPGTLSQMPLIGMSSTPANLMILLDNSPYMNVMIAAAPYVKASTTCPVANYLDTYVANNVPAGRVINDLYTPDIYWVNHSTSLNGASGKYVQVQYYTCPTTQTSPCYTGTKTYMNIPLATFGYTAGKTCFTSNAFYASPGLTNGHKAQNDDYLLHYSGDFLNWLYIDKAANFVQDTTNTNQYYHSSVTSMWTLANQVWRDLLNTPLTNVKVGIATLANKTSTTPYGAVIALAPIDISTGKATLDAFTPTLMPYSSAAGRPIASAMAQIGQYFRTAMPTNADISTTTAGTFFNIAPQFAAGVSTTSPIMAACQQNFLLVITGGDSSFDDNTTPASIATALKNYYPRAGGTLYSSVDYWWLPNVGGALYDTDLAPNLNDDYGTAVVNNMNTYGLCYNTSGGESNFCLGLRGATEKSGGLYQSYYYFYANGTAVNHTDMTLPIIAASMLSQLMAGTGLAFNSTSLQTGSALYKASYQTGKATGDLQKIALDPTTGVVSATPAWSFQSILQLTTPSARFMFTNTGVKTAALFTSTNLTGLSAQQQADLNQGASAADGKGAARIDYIRGSSATSSFRVRTSILGDIVNSSPTYVGPPVAGLYPSNVAYTAFASANAGRTPMVYVGDNSGVFHAINAATGAEAFGFLPLNLFSNAASQGYHYLTDPSYVHRFYINGPNTVADSYVGTAWRTMLVSSEGAGGQGVFALDVTNPNNFTSGNEGSIFKWEFSSATDADLGYTYSKPIIGKMNDGKWYAIFGNGYNSTNGVAKLFIVNLAGPSGASWVSGTDYYELTTGSGSVTTPDGLSSPTAVDLDNNGTIDRIYAGSVLGKMWSFDVSSATAASWGSGVQLIDVGQPITSAPLVTAHPTITASGNGANRMVYFGTGQYLTQADNSDTSARGLYAVWDNAAGTATTSQLVTQTLTTSGIQRTVSANPVDYTTKRGWMMALSSGERNILTPILASTTVFFATMQPLAASAVPCTTNNGLGWLLAVNQKDGSSSSQVMDVNGDGLVNASDKSGADVVMGIQLTAGYANDLDILSNNLYSPLSDGSISKIVVSFVAALPAYHGRLSTQEITGESK